MNGRFFSSLFLSLACAGAAPAMFAADDGIELISARPQFEKVDVVMRASGVLDSSKSININAPRTRYPRKLVTVVDEGTLVKKGDVLATFDTSMMEERLETLEYSGLHAKYKDTEMSFQISVNERVATYKSKVENEKISKITYDSMEFAPEMERKKALIRLNQASADVKIAENRIRQEEQRRDIQLRNIQDQIDQNRRDIEKLKADIDSFTVKAPSEGIVVYPKIKISGAERKVQIGDSLYWDQLFLTIPNLFEMVARVEVDEKDIRRIKLGQKCRIMLEAFRDASFTGEVSKIERLAQIKSNNPYIKIFNVDIKINERDLDKLRPGMNARAEILTNSFENAATIPLDFILRDGGAYYICAFKDGSIVREDVELLDFTDFKAVLKSAPKLVPVKPTPQVRKALEGGRKNLKPEFIPYDAQNG